MAQAEMPISDPMASTDPALARLETSVDGLTVHVVGRITESVSSFLLPTLKAMQANGRMQALLYVADRYGAETVTHVPAEVAKLPVHDGSTMLSRANALYQALARLSRRHRVTVLHVHGLLPCLAAARWLRSGDDREIDVLFSPHSSRALMAPFWMRRVIGQILRLGMGRTKRHVIVSLQPEADLLAPFGSGPAQVVECPVSSIFFQIPRKEARRPSIMSCNLDGQRSAVERYARIAVLLNDERLGISFNWVGRADAGIAAILKAAGIGQFATSSDEQRAQRLSSAWIYLAPIEERGFPVRLIEAMAAGLPCVALDSPVHSSVLDDCVTGYLCADQDQLLKRVAELLDSSQVRWAMGAAARRAAAERFAEDVFSRHLLSATVMTAPQERHAAAAIR